MLKNTSRNRWLTALVAPALALATLAGVSAQQSTTTPTVVRLDPALDAIIDADASLEIVMGDPSANPGTVYPFGRLEGPLWVQEGDDGYLLFCDVAANAVLKFTPPNTISTFLKPSGYPGTDLSNFRAFSNGRFNMLLFGATGLGLDPQGRLVLAAIGARAVTRREQDGTVTILADRFEGKRLNGPNDLTVKFNGTVYFTDLTSVMRDGAQSKDRELPFNGIFGIKDGRVFLVDRDPFGGGANGITLSPDDRYLYASSAGRRIIRYEVQPDDSAINGQIFVDMTAEKEPGNIDGMKVDATGNIYATGPGGIWIMSPAGKHLGTIRGGAAGPAVNFGGADRRTLYITNAAGLSRIQLKAAGHPRR